MRLVSFERDGRRGYGFVDDGAIVVASDVLGHRFNDLPEVLRDGGTDEVRGTTAPKIAPESVTLLPPVDAQRIFCIGVNYASHRDEMGRVEAKYPTVFVRFASSIVGPGAPLIRPAQSDKFDYEGELAVVIGRAGRRIERGRALEHVAGYSCFNDGSVRDYQRHSSQFTAGKNFDRSGSFGPWIVTTDEIPDPSQLLLTTRLNGEVMQKSTTDLLIFDVPALIVYLSEFTELMPGDVIATGTPGGVGVAREPAVFMQPGDRVEVDITGVGTLANPIAAEG